MPLYCHQGHKNQSGSRFCHQCGERLDLPTSSGIYPGRLLGDRYSLVRQLGQGGFGRTYLAEDTNRFNELCVLKEFSPQAQNTQLLQKAEELFEREAGVLYKLQHPQIPRFRELFRVTLDGKTYLFLVQDYVEGQTYQELLEARKQQGMLFGEAEVMLLLLQILPILEYIHSLGVIHRDISPDNIILRNCDHLPVLIDFGGVKQVAATVATQFKQSNVSSATLIGKAGYAPYEQIHQGTVYPHSDLYALAATMMALLTGKEPQELIDDRTLTWNWQAEVNLSPSLCTVFDKMLSHRLSDRYQSAREVLQALTSSNYTTSNYGATQPPNSHQTQATVAVAPPRKLFAANSLPSPIVGAASASIKVNKPSLAPKKILLTSLPLVVVIGLGWWTTNSWLQRQTEISSEPTSPISQPKPQFSPAEQKRKNQLRDRRLQLGINNRFYIALVNQAYWDKYPDERGRSLKVTPEDAALRADWDQIAAKLLEQLEPLSSGSRRRLGSYTKQNRDRASQALSKLNLSSRALDDLTDATFWEMFPQQQGKNFLAKPIGQVWYALADDKLKAISSGTAYEKIQFDSGANGKQVSGSFKPGEGKAYVAELAKDQQLKLELQADSKVLLSIYSPTGKIILEDSGDRSWLGTLPEGGFYEFVVISTASEQTDYQLNITVDNPTSPPDDEKSDFRP